ncbi:hypothetical protein D3C87_1244760 [compost metagenome]
MDLDGGTGSERCSLGGGQLGVRGAGPRQGVVGGALGSGGEDDGAGELDFHLSRGQQVFHRLIDADGLAELGAFLGVVDGQFDAALGQTDALGGGEDGPAFQRRRQQGGSRRGVSDHGV